MKMKYKPMLAYPVSDKPIDYESVVYMQPKLDGVRCLIQCDNGQVTAYSRNDKEWKNINHILEDLAPFFNDFPNVVLAGELYNHDFKDDFESIISMVRKTKPTDEDRYISAQNVHFHCYDIIDIHKSYMQRRNFIVQNLPIRDCINGVFTQLLIGKNCTRKFLRAE